MSQKKIGEVKRDKWFRIWDLVIYGVIVLIIVALFLAVTFTRDKKPADGIKISYMGSEVFTYDYAQNEYKITSPKNITVEEDGKDRLILVFSTDDKSGYNKIEINKSGRSVRVTDSNCSSHKDCVYTPAIKDNSSAISCPPHNLIIQPLTKVVHDDGDIVVG